MTEDHERIDELLAGYVLLSLEGEDAAEADRLLSEHVPGCARCRRTLADFQALSGDLALAAAPLGWFAMHDYQRRRVLTLFDPTQDPLGAGYHIIQSTIAVGSGGVYGKGWLNGTQSHLEFLPERATDFIFAVYCEEFGLVGVVVLLLAYALIIVRGIQIALDAQDMFGRLTAASLTLRSSSHRHSSSATPGADATACARSSRYPPSASMAGRRGSCGAAPSYSSAVVAT